MRQILSIALVFASVSAAAPALAADERNVVPGLTAAGAPLGLHGVDPVAFIDIGNRLDGDASYTMVHDGVAYYFSSADNAKAFAANPDRYVPQNGGFCTYGVSVRKKFDGDPRFAAIIDGKLYVFLSAAILKAFNRDRAGVIERAETEWSRIEHIAATDL